MGGVLTMPATTWETTDNDRMKARMGINFQLTGHNFNNRILKDSHFQDFIDHQVEVIASLEAQCRFYRSVITEKNIEQLKEEIRRAL
jgi:hypothetical protein